MSLTTKKVATIEYDFAVDGGAISVITPAITETLPVGAIVTDIKVDCETTFTGTATPTIEFAVGAVPFTGDIDVLDWDAGDIETVAVLADHGKVAVAGPITLEVKAQAITAGKAKFFLEYLY